MMHEDDIKKVDEWFSKHTEYYGTNHEGDEYTISEYDLEDFSNFLSDEFPDLCLIRCCFGTGNSKFLSDKLPDLCLIRCFFGTDDVCIWFYRKDLEEAVFY